MAKASIKEMEELHKALAVYFSDALESGEELSSGTLAAINAFLKVNNITVDVVEGSPSQDLQATLKSLIKEEV